jgi:heme/copper-type cytochrome/quinol oxidase subunit 2
VAAVAAIVAGAAVAALYYTQPSTSGVCIRPQSGFLIIVSDKGYNDSIDRLATSTTWPVLTVHQGQDVNIVVCNTDNQAHGFQISHYLNSTTNVINPGKSQSFSFVANEAGTFRIFTGIADSVSSSEQNGQLIVTS